MRKFFSICLLALSALLLTGAEKLPAHFRDFAPDKLFPGHLQGIAADESGIYWSCYDRIMKTKWDGTFLCSVKSPPHAGDCCIKDGKLYVSTTYYDREDILKYNGVRAAVYVYDCKTLRYIKHILLKDIPFPDAIAWHKGRFYLGDNSAKKAHLLNVFYVYDKDFKFIKREVIAIGIKTLFGAQNLCSWNDKLIATFYPAEPYNGSTLIDPPSFTTVGLFPLKASVGLAIVPESIAGKRDVFCIGKVAGPRGAYFLRASFFHIENGKAVPFPVKLLKIK